MPRKVHTHVFVTLFTTTVGLGALGLSKPAAACSCAVDIGFYGATPADGAEDVPTDVTLFGSVGLDTTVTLFDEQDNEVATQRNYLYDFDGFCSTTYELDPTAELLPHHTYRLVATGDDQGFDTELPKVVSFTTGDGPVEVAESPAPTAHLAVFTTRAISSCTESALQACLTTEQGLVLEVRVSHEQGVRRYVDDSRALNYFELGDLEGEFCVAVHTRDLAGHLSEPYEHCFDTAEVYELNAEDDTTLYSPCESEEVQSLLKGELPDFGDAGPTFTSPAADAGSAPLPTQEADGSVDTAANTEDIVSDTTDNDGRTTEPFENVADAAIDEGDATEPAKPVVEKNAVTNEPEQSGCSVTSPTNRGPTPWFGMLVAGFAATLGRRTWARRR